MSLATNLAQIPNITVNRIPRATATGFVNSTIFDNGTHIGIGTNSPANYFTTTVTIDGASSQGIMFRAGGVDRGFIYQDGSFIQVGSNAGGVILKSNDTERMRITSTGAVGIGTSAPGAILDVLTSGSIHAIFNSTATQGGYIAFQRNGTSFGYIGQSYHIVIGGSVGDMAMASTAGLVFSTGSSLTQRMSINSNGDIRVGDPAGADARLMVKTWSPVAYNPNGYNGTNTNIRLMTGGTPTTGSSTGISFAVSGSTEVFVGAVQNSSGYGDLVIQTYHAAYSEKIRIYSNGVTQIYSLAGGGNRTVTADASGILSASSDSSLKQEDINHNVEGLAEILRLKPRAYKWLNDIEKRGENAATEIGFFANEVAPIIPSAAPMGNDGLYGFYDRSVIAALVKGMQEQQEQINSLKAQLGSN